jgi:serine/threonine-protein kinase
MAEQPSPAQLVEELRRDQCERWQAGERVPAEAYLNSHPALQSDPSCALELVYQEVLLREERGEEPQLQEYLERFPQFAAQLRPLFVVHRALESSSWLESDPAETPPEVTSPASSGAAADLPVVPGYEVLGEVGRGGMGVVYQARQMGLNRLVALKMIKAGDCAGPQELARFRIEAEAVGRLQHPHIVQVYEVGEHAGLPYLAMEYINGGSLARKLAGTPLPARQAARLVETLARAMHHAHQRGIVHRDLKPTNVLLASEGASPPDSEEAGGLHSPLATFIPKISDFGLARDLEGRAGEQTPSEALVGTPSYMAPEQAEGKASEVGPAGDIYALGAILYELLTGRPPFKAATHLETLLQVRTEDPLPPSRLQSKTPRDLETICLKCLAKPPGKRYSDALALAEDLRRFQAGETILARPVGRIEHLLNWAKRKPATAALWCVSLAVVLVGGATWWWLQQQEAQRREEVARQEGRSRQAIEADLEQAEVLQRQARWAEAEVKLAQALSRLGEEGGDDLRQRVEQAQANLRLVKKLDDIRLEKATLVEGKWAPPKAAPAYEAAFREHGLDVLAGEEAALARRIGASPVKEQLVAALEDWASVAGGGPARARLLTLARKADPDPKRDRFRDPVVWTNLEKLQTLAAEPGVQQLSPLVLGLVGDQLEQLGGDGVSLLQAAQRRHPGDFWLNFALGGALNERGQGEKAVGYYRAALAVRPQASVVYNNLATALARKGDLDGAIAEYHKVFALDPKYAPAHMNLGLVLKEKGDLEGSMAAYHKALALAPKDARAHNNLGITLAEKGDLAGAIAKFQKAITLDPKYASPHYNLGLALSEKQDPDGAIAAYQKALALHPKFAPAYNNLGSTLMTKKDVKGAIACYDKAIALDPKYAQAYSNLGTALEAKGDLPGAVAAQHKAIALDPKNATAHSNLGVALQAQGDLPGAIAAYHKAIALDRRYARAHYNLGNALQAQGDLKGAIAAYQKSIALKPKFALAYYNLGLVLYGQKDLDGAIAEYQKAIAIDPQYAPAHLNLGAALFGKRNVAGAIAAFKQAIALDPKNAPAHLNLGSALYDQKDLKGAIAAFKQAIALHPKLALPHYHLGLALQRQEDLKGAIAAFKEAVALDPKLADAHFNLGKALYRQNDLKGAIAAFQQVIALSPKLALAHYSLGVALNHHKDFEGSIAAYHKAIALDPKYAPAHSNLGNVLIDKGDLDGAIAAFKKALAVDPKLAPAHASMSQALLMQGRFAAAQEAARLALKFLPSNHPWREPCNDVLQQAEYLLKLNARLAAFLEGKEKITDAGEQLALAYLCQRYKQRYALAARFFAAAFAAQSKLANDLQGQHRYRAACAAALAAAGQGKDAVKLEYQERAKLRRQALGWLKADLTACSRLIEKDSPQARAFVLRTLRSWNQDPTLTGLRDESGLVWLVEEEQKACRLFWADVDALLEKARPE